jgi:hypothetical protein
VDKRAQRTEWEARKQANGYSDTNVKDTGDGDGDDWFGEGRAQSNRQLWDEA